MQELFSFEIEEEGCAMPISSIGGIGGELEKNRYDGAFCETFLVLVVSLKTDIELFVRLILLSRFVWHPSTEDVCALRQHCGRRVSRLTAAGDNLL